MFFHCRITDVHSVKVERLLLPLLPVCECRNNTTPAYYLKIGDFHCLLPLCVHVCRRHKSCKFKYKSLNLTCYGKDFVFLHFQSDFSFIFFLFLLHIFICSRKTVHTCPMEMKDIILPQINWVETEKLDRLHLSCLFAATCFSLFGGWYRPYFSNVGRGCTSKTEGCEQLFQF